MHPCWWKRTEDDDVQDEDDEANYTASSAEFPGVAVGAGADGFRGHCHGEEAGLEHEVERETEHCLWIMAL